MAAKRGLKVLRRKSLSLVNAEGDGALTREELGIQARLVFDQGVERNFEFKPPRHFNNESGAREAGIRSLLSPDLEQPQECGRVELLQRHIFAAAEQRQGALFTGPLDVDPRFTEFGRRVFNSAFAAGAN